MTMGLSRVPVEGCRNPNLIVGVVWDYVLSAVRSVKTTAVLVALQKLVLFLLGPRTLTAAVMLTLLRSQTGRRPQPQPSTESVLWGLKHEL